MVKARVALQVFAVAVLVAALLATPVAAQWPGSWVTSFQIMNLGTETAAVQILYLREDGSTATTQEYSITKGSSINVYQPSVPGLPEGFKGSVVVSSDQPIAAIGSEQVTYADGSIGNSQYSGLSENEIGTRFYLPNVNRRFGGGQWSSRITVQNTQSTQINVTVTFYNPDASVRDTDTVSIPGNGSVTLSQTDDAELPDGWLGAAIVEATGNVAVIADVRSADGRLESYNGFSSGSNTAYLPTLLLGFGANKWNSSFQVFNVGATEASLTITYYTAGNPTPAKVVETTLPHYQSINRYQPTVDSDLGSNWIGSAVIQSTQPIVVVGTQSSGAPGTRLASIYGGAASGAAEVVLPTILRYFGGSKFVTSLQVMNVGATDASVTVEYYAPGNPTPVKVARYDGSPGAEPKIPRFVSVNRYQPTADPELGDGWQGSVRVVSDQPVVVLASQHGTARTGDSVGQYNGIAVAP
ncbi:MAG: hypothetical protein QME94_09730 [Anaerolineae bacterium]|nr:hypothetical protein [Anaerolineae bacterium]